MPDYCDEPDEVAKNPDAKRHFRELANGNEHAFEFMWHFWCFVHCYDDMVDRDKPVSAEQAARAFAQFFLTINYNPFYLQHKDQLFGFIIQVFNRWLDGDEWEKSPDKMKRIASHVVRSGDVELYLHVGYLCGGWDHLRAMKHTRGYDSNGVEQREMGGAV